MQIKRISIFLMIFLFVGCSYNQEIPSSNSASIDSEYHLLEVDKNTVQSDTTPNNLTPINTSGAYSPANQEKANCIIDITNQNFNVPTVEIIVYFDDIPIIEGLYDVGNQHEVSHYYYKTTGEHTLKAMVGDSLLASKTIDFDANSLTAIGISYYGASIDIHVANKPLLYD